MCATSQPPPDDQEARMAVMMTELLAHLADPELGPLPVLQDGEKIAIFSVARSIVGRQSREMEIATAAFDRLTASDLATKTLINICAASYWMGICKARAERRENN